MRNMTASSDRISKIIKVIDEIAFQTNILALNASVEAARAGDAGMGFAVVADEVRNLAQRSAQAAKDTADLIEDSVAKSNAGKVKVDQVAGAIRVVTEEAGKIKVLVDEISVGSQEQARGIEQIGSAITQMDQVTQKAAASAEEGASAAEELTAQSESLKRRGRAIDPDGRRRRSIGSARVAVRQIAAEPAPIAWRDGQESVGHGLRRRSVTRPLLLLLSVFRRDAKLKKMPSRWIRSSSHENQERSPLHFRGWPAPQLPGAGPRCTAGAGTPACR